jgi:hypothetical protein
MIKAKPTTTKYQDLSTTERIELLANILIEIIDSEQTYKVVTDAKSNN